MVFLFLRESACSAQLPDMKTNRNLNPAPSALASAQTEDVSPAFEVSEEDLLGRVLGRVHWQLLLSFQKVRGHLLREHPVNKYAF